MVKATVFTEPPNINFRPFLKARVWRFRRRKLFSVPYSLGLSQVCVGTSFNDPKCYFSSFPLMNKNKIISTEMLPKYDHNGKSVFHVSST